MIAQTPLERIARLAEIYRVVAYERQMLHSATFFVNCNSDITFFKEADDRWYVNFDPASPECLQIPAPLAELLAK